MNLLNNKTLQKIIVFVLGGISSLAFPPYGYWVLLFLSFSGLAFFLNKQQSVKDGFWLGLCFGLSYFGFSLSWIRHALEFFPDLWKFIPLVAVAPALFGLYTAVTTGLATISRKHRIFVFATLWGFFEWVRAWLFTGFSWNLLSGIWYKVPPVFQILSLTGPYFLSFISVFLFSTPALWFQKKERKFIYATLILFVLGTTWGAFRLLNTPQSDVLGVKLRLVQPDISQNEKWSVESDEETFMKLYRLSKQNLPKDINAIIWPESAISYYLERPFYQEMVISLLDQDQKLLTGSVRIADIKKRQIANSMLVINDLGYIEHIYDKKHLVPFGEYMPMSDIIPWNKIVPVDGEFKKGSFHKTALLGRIPPVGMSICYEIIFPNEVVESPRPEWILNVANDAWYGISAGPYQHLLTAQMRAVEEGLPVIRNTNSGISAVIAPTGIILNQLPLGEKGVLDTSLPRSLPKTIYSRTGNLPFLLIIIGYWIFLIIRFLRRRYLKNAKFTS